MAKLFFIPVSIAAGLIAGSISRKIFDQLWGLVDEEEPPDSKHRDIPWSKLLLAGAIQGAIFRMVKEAIDHGGGSEPRRVSTGPNSGVVARLGAESVALRHIRGHTGDVVLLTEERRRRMRIGRALVPYSLPFELGGRSDEFFTSDSSRRPEMPR